MPLILTHGWPGSFVEMEPIIPLLADPGAHGGDPADAFDVVVPSLPGYGSFQAPLQARTSSREIAVLWKGLMAELGYTRFGAQGGDIESVMSIDTLLTNISLYWFNNNLAASLRPYKENRFRPLIFSPDERSDPPLGVALFPHELPMPPRAWLKRVFDVHCWTIMPAGSHFAALEQPCFLAKDIRSFFRPLRSYIYNADVR